MNISQDTINNKLKILGDKLLKYPYKNGWSIDNPTYGYCYIISEAIYHYDDTNLFPYYIDLGDIGIHWFLKDENDNIIDFTSAQFDFELNYNLARRGSFFKGSVETKKGFISKRGQEMAIILGVV